MKKYIIGLIVFMFGIVITNAQEADSEKKVDKPVRSPFESGILIDNQTNVIPTAKTLEMVIQHRFGKMDNGLSDMWGIYSPGANIRLGFNYSVRDNLVVGYGLTKKNMYSDFQVKWNVVEQTRENTIPVAVTLYGNMAIDGRKDAVFGTDYKFTNRMSYFSQLIVGRKFNDWFSLQATGSFAHYNSVDSTMNHDVIGVGFNGRIKFSAQSSFIFQYDVPLKIQGISEQKEFDAAKPNLALVMRFLPAHMPSRFISLLPMAFYNRIITCIITMTGQKASPIS
nr:hypothetical protein [Bacteroidota bacterium]